MLKRSLILLAALASFAADTRAADMPQPVKSVAVAPVTTSANGLYFGALLADAKSRVNAGADIKASGAMGGAVVGYAMYAGTALFAVETDGQYLWARDNKDCGLSTCDMKPSWLLTQRAVIGMPLGSLTGAVQRAASAPPSQWPVPLNVPASLSGATAMPYLTAGVAERRFELCVDSAACNKSWSTGWTTGGGFRVPVSAGFTMDIGYLYVGYGKHLNGNVPAAFRATSEQIMRASLHYHM